MQICSLSLCFSRVRLTVRACTGVAAALPEQPVPARRRHALPEVPAPEARRARRLPRSLLRLRPRLARAPAAPGQRLVPEMELGHIL